MDKIKLTDVVEGKYEKYAQAFKRGDLDNIVKNISKKFSLTDDAVKKIYNPAGGATKTFDDLVKDLDNAIKTDIKLGHRVGVGGTVGKNAEEVARQMMLKHVLESPNKLSKTQLKKIQKKYFDDVATKVRDQERNLASKAGGKPKPTSPTQPKPTQPKPNQPKKPINDTLKKILKIKLTGLAIKAALLGGGVITAIWLWKKYFRDEMTEEEAQESLAPLADQINQIKTDFPCLINMLDDEGVTFDVDNRGFLLIINPQTGVDEYDRNGGLVFSISGRVYYRNSKRAGGFRCEKKDVLSEQERPSTEITTDELDDIVVELYDQLDGDWFNIDNTDLIDARNVLRKAVNKTYKGRNAIEAVKDGYKEFAKSDLLSDVKRNLSNKIRPSGAEARSEMIKMLSGNFADGVQSGVAGISITWDDSSGKSGVKTKFKNCDGNPFPHPLYCKSDQIADVQRCVGDLEVDGMLGDKTISKLKELGYDTAVGLSQEIYTDIMNKCKNKDSRQGGSELERQPERIEPISSKDSLKMSPIASGLDNQETLKNLGDKLYKALISRKNLVTDANNKNRIVYKDKGKNLNNFQLQALDYKLGLDGFTRLKQKEKRYGEKYVWVK